LAQPRLGEELGVGSNWGQSAGPAVSEMASTPGNAAEKSVGGPERHPSEVAGLSRRRCSMEVREAGGAWPRGENDAKRVFDLKGPAHSGSGKRHRYEHDGDVLLCLEDWEVRLELSRFGASREEEKAWSWR